MTDQGSELRPAYRTLNEPSRLLGLSVGGWITVLLMGGAGYGWLLISPLPWRANVSLAAIVLGLPAVLMLLREQSTITLARLLAGAIAWRSRPALLVAPTDQRPVRRGALRLDNAAGDAPPAEPCGARELPWLAQDGGNRAGHDGARP